MLWGLLIGAILVGATIFAYREKTRDSRQLGVALAPLAERHGGVIEPASLLRFPALRFENEGRRCTVSALSTSGVEGSGPFTFVDLMLPTDTGQQIRITRRGSDEGTTEAARRDGAPASVLEAFDASFRIKGGDPVSITQLLDGGLREKLSGARLPGLEARVTGPRIGVHVDGIAASAADLETMVAIALLLADRCPRHP